MRKAVYFLLAALVFVCGSGCEKQEKTIELVTQYSGAELDLCGDELREYLSEDDFNAECNFLLEHEGDYYDWQNIHTQPMNASIITDFSVREKLITGKLKAPTGQSPELTAFR